MASAEDALSEAFAAALADWPLNGCPSNPEGWLLTIARRKMIDFTRRRRSGEIAAGQLQRLAEGLDAAAADAAKDMEIYDALLALSGSAVVAINRALAIAEVHGAGAALEAMQELASSVSSATPRSAASCSSVSRP